MGRLVSRIKMEASADKIVLTGLAQSDRGSRYAVSQAVVERKGKTKEELAVLLLAAIEKVSLGRQ